ncbi:MAG: HAD family hydrolase [Candidatus Niameybacter stercoravium]|nr:HAD family hydrolase [Candidatus Niameybacter stercoravium]
MKYILFDLDGTLTDPKEGITKAVQYALKKHGIEVENRNELEKFIGPSLKYSFMEFYSFSEEQALQAIEDYREYFKPIGLYENEVYPGIVALLEELHSRGMKLFIATSKPTVFASQIAAHFNMDKYFTEIVGSQLDGTRVEKDEVIGYILEKYNLTQKDHIIMVGDRKFDILGAKKHGLQTIGVSYGYSEDNELEEAGAFYIADTVEQLAAYLLAD